ncbi:hypothetical protein [Chitinophaga sp. MM2321]|uniref:hypothetical protein n=1 Tax=Chitinophaga sp. MM2321 TaxID=3137178 RepID=UPI0032D58117
MAASPTQINYIRHLNAFFAQVRGEDRLHANHVSLYLALFQVWNYHRFQHPFPILREEVMRLSCIGSRSTYVRCLKHLDDCRYIIYAQAKQAYATSYVSIIPLADFIADPDPEQLVLFQDPKAGTMRPKSEPPDPCKTGPHQRLNNGPDTRTNSGPRAGPKVGHFNKHINNNKRGGENRLPPSKKIYKNETENPPFDPGTPGAENAPGAARMLPTLSQVQELFNAHVYPEMEAGKFFHHYQANGWRQGGKTLITDWQAAAHKWILNIHPRKTENNDKYTKSTARPGRLHVNENKSYSDPL